MEEKVKNYKHKACLIFVWTWSMYKTNEQTKPPFRSVSFPHSLRETNATNLFVSLWGSKSRNSISIFRLTCCHAPPGVSDWGSMGHTHHLSLAFAHHCCLSKASFANCLQQLLLSHCRLVALSSSCPLATIWYALNSSIRTRKQESELAYFLTIGSPFFFFFFFHMLLIYLNMRENDRFPNGK